MEKQDLLTIALVTYNEEKNIQACIKSFCGIADRVLVLDNCSTDQTAELARQLGADVIESTLLVRDRIKWALSDSNITTKWVLFIDADERMTKESAKEFKRLCEQYADDKEVNGIVVKYRMNFLGKNLYHGGFSPLKKLRAFKPGTAYYETMDVDEHYILKSGKMVYMKNEFLHFDFKGLKLWIDKHSIYAERAAIDYRKKILQDETVTYRGLEKSAKIKRLLKYKIYYRLPSGFRAWCFYFYCYYLRLGFLDGREGKIFAFLHSYWYRFLIDSFIYENKIMGDDKKFNDPQIVSCSVLDEQQSSLPK